MASFLPKPHSVRATGDDNFLDGKWCGPPPADPYERAGITQTLLRQAIGHLFSYLLVQILASDIKR